MSDYSSDLITKAAAAQTKQFNGLVNADDKSGIVLYATCIVTILTAWAVGDTVQLVDLPPGAVVIPQLSHITSNAPGTNLTLDIGDSLVTGRYALNLAKTAGGQSSFGSTAVQPAAAIAPYRTDPLLKTDKRVFATIKTGTTGLTNLTPLVVTIAYRGKS